MLQRTNRDKLMEKSTVSLVHQHTYTLLASKVPLYYMENDNSIASKHNYLMEAGRHDRLN